MICIGCPMGCELTVTGVADTSNKAQCNTLAVTGNQCKIGETYGKEEVTNPTRNITSSIRITGGDMSMLSVKTARPVPKAAIMDCVKAIKQVKVTAPVATGDIILADAAGTGVNIVATRDVKTM